MKIKFPKSKREITKTSYDKFDGIHLFTIKGVDRYLVIRDIPLILRNPKGYFKRAYCLSKSSFYRNTYVFKLWVNEVVLRKPIYAFAFSRDCDMCESSSYHKFNSRAEFKEYEESLYENAEGTTYFNRVSERVYLENANEQPYVRDRVMEAVENTGQGYYV
jgi:hypothetical protein